MRKYFHKLGDAGLESASEKVEVGFFVKDCFVRTGNLFRNRLIHVILGGSRHEVLVRTKYTTAEYRSLYYAVRYEPGCDYNMDVTLHSA